MSARGRLVLETRGDCVLGLPGTVYPEMRQVEKEILIAVAAEEALERGGGRVDALVNNGAFACPGAVEDLPRAALREIFETNLFGQVDLTNRLLPAMRAAGRGRVVMISSVLGLGDFERLKAKAETIEIGGRKCRLIALDDLIAAKEAVGREKDLLAAKELRAIAEKKRSGPRTEQPSDR